MKKLLLICVAITFVAGCKHEANEPKPLSETIRKVWKAQTVKYDAITIYTRGGTNNTVTAYDNFRLELSSANSVTLTEFEGNSFTGSWELSSDNQKLTLQRLSPQPTGTNGILEYTINASSETELQLIRTTASAKTGGSTNSYTLIPQ
jgi:hypothetical protein